MNVIKVIIIDDEEHNRYVLESLLAKYCPYVRCIAQADSADTAYELINIHKPDLIFLDIKMPKKSGFDLLKMFNEINFEVIFVSAFDEYAITAFEFNALGYILKPIDYEKLIQSVEKAGKKIALNQHNDSVLHFVKTIEDQNDLITKINFHHGGKVILVPINDIVAVEAFDNNCEVTLKNNDRLFSSKSLKVFESLLNQFDYFIRVHKSVIINVNELHSYSKHDICIITMKNGKEYEVSRRKKHEVLEKIKHHNFKM